MPPEIVRDIVIALIAGAPALIKSFIDMRAQQKQMAALKKQIQDQVKRNDALALENQDLHTQIDTLIAMAGDAEKRILSLNDSYKSLLNRYSELNSRNIVLEAQYKELSAQYNVLKIENEQLRAQLAQVKKQTGELRKGDNNGPVS